MNRKSARVNVLGVGICITNMADTVSTINGWTQRDKHHYVCVTGVHGVMECQKDEHLRRIHNASGLTVPDGMPMVWAGRIKGFSHMGRVYGPDLMLEVCKMSLEHGYSHFLYGGNVGVADELKAYLNQRFPGINIIGTFTPPFRPLNRDEEAELIDRISRLKPELFWVGLSTPKQEKFMADYINRLDTKIMVGVGAAFDIHTGRVKDAPIWVKKSGLQWLHRLFQEPHRLWKRYLFNNPLFLVSLSLQLTGLKRYKGPG